MGDVNAIKQNVVDILGIKPRIWTIGSPETPGIAERWLSRLLETGSYQ
jgi:hypothetical protein